MANLFWRQLRALVWKNWIVLSKHSFLNILRCFVLPVAYGIFLAVAQIFLNKPNFYGIGQPIPIYSLQSQLTPSLSLIWADSTNGQSNPTPKDIIARITSQFTPSQLNAVKQVSSPNDIPAACPQNFNLFSECFAAVAFYDIPANGNGSAFVNYTIWADGGLVFVDVVKHRSDFEKRILPLQWAIDQAIIDMQTGVQVPTPLEWPFSQETNEEQATRMRLSYIRGIRELLVIALFVSFIGIAYQLPGAVAGERAGMLTAHMRAMGLLDKARIISWHLSLSLTYLPAWIIVGLTWSYRIFSASNTGLILIVHLLLGLTLASWSFFIAAPFGKSPQLAAVVSTFLGILLAIIALVFKSAGTGAAFIFTIIFPPGFYIFAIRAICGYENHQLATNVLKGDPDKHLVLLPLIIAAIIDIFLWPHFAVLLERRLYEPPRPSIKAKLKFWNSAARTSNAQTHSIDDDIAISIKNLNKTFKALTFSSKGLVTAIEDLSLEIPKRGIFVLLGSNGAGKSTALSVIGGLMSHTRGTITFEGGLSRPPRGTIGIVPQKNVLFPELTCIQTLRVWQAVKWTDSSAADEDLEALLRDCDLGRKIHANAATLSGGQKRKLQLAIGLLGGSKIVLVDECTSGVDPLSRRALWRTLTSFREDRTIIFTTHFLDEADLLADYIAILATPGKLVASGTPVSLKRDLGEGYSVQVLFAHSDDGEKDTSASRDELLHNIRAILPQTEVSMSSPHQFCYHLKTRDVAVVQQVLQLLDTKTGAHGIVSYDILGTTIEDIFLDLMSKHKLPETDKQDDEQNPRDTLQVVPPSSESDSSGMVLATGRPVSPFRQAFTIFYKRMLIARRSWLTPLLAILVAVTGSTIPLVLISGRQTSCTRHVGKSFALPLFLPNSPIVPFFSLDPPSRLLTSPPGIAMTLGNSTQYLRVTDVTDSTTFVNDITQNYRNFSLGGISLDLSTGNSLIAWEATPPGLNGPTLLNLVSNIFYNRALNSTGNSARTPTIIRAAYEAFPPIAAGTLFSLNWTGFYGAVMAVYPAFFALYVSRERRSSVQAMQLSNGLADPIGLWLGHLMFDTVTVVILSTIIIIVFATASNQFHGLGLFWVVLVLYGIAGALFSYCVSLIVASPLAAFATVAGYQYIMFILYTAAYLLVLTYGKTSESNWLINICHFTLSIVAPVTSPLRAAFVSVNLFSLLCDGNNVVTLSSMGSIKRYGGPIVYLIVYSLILLAILVWVDSGTRFRSRKLVSSGDETTNSIKEDVVVAAQEAQNSNDSLRVLNVSKTYNREKVVDDVSIGVSLDTVFALLGPNGAGKTTTFNIIRGDVVPDVGDVIINGTSVVRHPRTARSALGVCPQFTAIDSQLTVREHLIIYGRLKGLAKGPELDGSVAAVMQGTALSMYADRLASKLSGGNQRKLSLAIALIGNPTVILIDEFSTGIDPKMKRDMWDTLRKVSIGKAVIITTHSMEEASALANRVGILAKRLLAVGTTESLSARYATYEVHFTCRTREEVVKARTLMSLFPGSRMADDVATRFEVPIDSGNGSDFSLAKLFNTLSSHGDFTEYTVEKATLESVFLKVIRENEVLEEDSATRSGRNCWMF